MSGWFSRINIPTMIAVFVGILVDKKLGLTDKIAARF